MTDLIAELAEVARLIRKDNAGAGQWGMPSAAVNYLRTHHAELTRILTDYAAIRAAHHDLVIRLGEVTTELEAARRDAVRLDWVENSAHCLDWDEHNPLRRVIKADDGEESCADTWREAIDLAMRDSAGDGSDD